jgi:hypothetical protein
MGRRPEKIPLDSPPWSGVCLYHNDGADRELTTMTTTTQRRKALKVVKAAVAECSPKDPILMSNLQSAVNRVADHEAHITQLCKRNPYNVAAALPLPAARCG